MHVISFILKLDASTDFDERQQIRTIIRQKKKHANTITIPCGISNLVPNDGDVAEPWVQKVPRKLSELFARDSELPEIPPRRYCHLNQIDSMSLINNALDLDHQRNDRQNAIRIECSDRRGEGTETVKSRVCVTGSENTILYCLLYFWSDDCFWCLDFLLVSVNLSCLN